MLFVPLLLLPPDEAQKAQKAEESEVAEALREALSSESPKKAKEGWKVAGSIGKA